MAQPRLKAEYFADAIGNVICKAPPLTLKQRKAIYERDSAICQQCGVPVMFGGITASPFQKIDSVQIDHIFPRSRGGQNYQSNLRLLCLTCNSQKGAK